jgi:UDP-GlcNAc:undecaprenyl-phosphate/decaprenyl-phosphate GlcNAc-1-phosphate transferase
MENLILGSILSFIISFYAIPVIILVANWKKLYDLPGERKIHSAPVPSLGGLGIFVGFTIGLLLFTNIAEAASVFQYIMATFIIIFFFGIKDDILMLSPMKKLLGQVAVAGILMWKANLLITNMHGFIYINTIPPAISYLLTGFTILVIMNAFNLIDGVDGLAASISIISCVSFGIFFLLNGDNFYALLAFCFTASLMAFLIYNFPPARIFMGDTGAMLSGAVNAILVIRFIETATISSILPVLASPAIGFGILLLPLLDTLRVFGIRILHGRSPFSPDRNHLHHLLLDLGFSHKKITLSLVTLSIVFIGITFLLLPLGTTKAIAIQIFIFFAGILFLNKKRRKTGKLHLVKSLGENEETPSRLRRGFTNIGRFFT